MIDKPPLLTMRLDWPRPSAAQMDAFRGVPSSMVSDAMDGRGAMSADVSPVLRGVAEHVVGSALTADNGAGNILATLALLELARPGDVAVVSMSGFQGCAAFGDRVAGMLGNSGVVGMVTDSPVRDAVGLEGVDMPVWATGLHPSTPHDGGPGRAGFDVVVGGVSVGAGDVIVADRDGVVVVPFAMIDTVACKLKRVQEVEAELDAKVAEGLTLPDDLRDFLQSDDVKRV